MPFIGGCIRPTGTMHACCDSQDPGTYSFEEIDEWRNSNVMVNLREELYNGIENEHCRRCWATQQLGGQSLRQVYNQSLVNATISKQIKAIAANNFITENDITFLDLKLGNLCNLKCLICGPENSTAWLPDYQKLFPNVNVEQFKYKVQNQINIDNSVLNGNIKRIHFHGGGEP